MPVVCMLKLIGEMVEPVPCALTKTKPRHAPDSKKSPTSRLAMAGLVPADPLVPAALVPPLAAAGVCVPAAPAVLLIVVPDAPPVAAGRPESATPEAPPVLGVEVDGGVDVAPVDESAGGALLQAAASDMNIPATRKLVSIRASIAVTIQRTPFATLAKQALRRLGAAASCLRVKAQRDCVCDCPALGRAG
jgi:hypothetical protein